MSSTKNLNQFTNDFRELERKIETGYIPENVAYKLDIFARAVLSNNVLSLFASFNNENPFLDTAVELFIASDNVSDTFNVLIDYIDRDKNRKTKTVTLTGTTQISVGSDIYSIFRMFNNSSTNQVGSRVVITSNVTGVPVDDNEVYSEMIQTSGVSANKSLSAFLTIPKGHTGFITKAYITADKNSDVKSALFLRPENEVFKFEKALSTFQQQSLAIDLFDRVKEKTDLKPIAIAQTGGITYIDYTILVINNEYLNKHIGV